MSKRQDTKRACPAAIAGLWLAATIVLAPLHALAQGGPSLRAQYDTLFKQNLLQPDNLDVAFKFADVATRLGDPEAAIGALERMLYYNPNLPRVRLELGVLYMKLGSYEMARTYFTSAIAGPETPVEVRQRVDAFLAEIDRRLEPHQFAAFAQTGLRYQTNANASPQSSVVKALGQDAFLDKRFRKQPDWNAFALGGFTWSADLGTPHGDTWDTSFFAYQSRQFDLGRFDLGVVELQTGPRIAVAPATFPGLSFRPYAIVNKVMLGRNNYLGTAGAGASLTFKLPTVEAEPYIEFRRRYYTKSFEYPLATEQSGHLVIVGLHATGLIRANLHWRFSASYSRAQTDAMYDRYRQTSFDLALPWDFPVLIGKSYARRWTLTPTIGVSFTDYDVPNFTVDPFHLRSDIEYRAGATLEAPVTDRVGFGLQALYVRDKSKIRNYDTTNFIVSAGPTLRF